MNLDKAIEILTEDTQHPTAGFMPELKEAEKLGIEALKLYQCLKASGDVPTRFTLSGETPQIDTNRSLHHTRQSLESSKGE